MNAGSLVRVINQRGSQRSLGTGTLIDADASRGWVLTCGHLFGEGVGNASVVLIDGRSFAARFVRCDERADLALLEIAAPRIVPMTIASDAPRPGDPVASCGFGGDGRLWCNQGRVLGYVTLVGGYGRETLELSGQARSGDSGGPVVDHQGRLVAVLFGTNGRVVDATFCGRVRAFLQGLTPRFGAQPADPPTIAEPTPPLVEVPPRVVVPPSERPVVPPTPRVEPPTSLPPAKAPWSERAKEGLARAAEPWIAARLTAVLVTLGLPAGVAALAGGAGAWIVLRRGRRKLQAELDRLRARLAKGTGEEATVPDAASPSSERHHNRYVPYEDSALDKAWSAAHARVAEKYPGAIPYLRIVEGVKDQLISGVEPAETH